MLGLPAATMRSGPLPSTIAILLSWVYVISSIILAAELSFVAMEEDNVSEVSFTELATKGLGSRIAHALFPFVVGITLSFFPFKVIDAANRFLCLVVLFSISALVIIGLFVGRMNILGSFAHASWGLSSVLPAVPVTVLILGFHVITPFVCKIAGNSVNEPRKAILVGGFVPLITVLPWNIIVLGPAGTNTTSSSRDPISFLLSFNPSALSAVQGYAFYAVSFPKQDCGNTGKVWYSGSSSTPSEVKLVYAFGSLKCMMMPLVLTIPVLIAFFFCSTFSRALDFAGIYANCFLFGILPPVLTYICQSKKSRSSIRPSGQGALLLLFSIAVIFKYLALDS
ncbi:tryptophan/tyrosine permease [Actinidia rufa]|uniref:Tryptophan/tyrosine permease n=1 Tax=Actinidia rufa TaxID=165716 RepID=A0A7J0E2J3_9ERIC|nr:tryptophan/tyrosine permease [Actinidia rufa]